MSQNLEAPDWAALAARRPEFAEAEHIWTTVLEPELRERERRRARLVGGVVRRAASYGAVGLLAPQVFTLTVFGGLSLAGLGVGSTAALIVGALATWRDWLRVFKMKSDTKSLILNAAAGPYGFRYETLHPDVSDVKTARDLAKLVEAETKRGKANDETEAPTPAYKTLKTADLLPVHHDLRFEDRITGARAGATFALVEAKLVDSGGDSATTVFEGILLSVDFPARFLGRTIIARSDKRIRTKARRGLERVKLVSRELDETFTVYSSDQVEARAILTPDRMERMIALEAIFEGGELRGVFEDGRMTLALEAGDQFEAGSIFKPLVDPARFVLALEEISKVCDLIDGFLDRSWRPDA